MGRQAALDPRRGFLVAGFGAIEEPAERRAVDQLALAPAAIGLVVGLVMKARISARSLSLRPVASVRSRSGPPDLP